MHLLLYFEKQVLLSEDTPVLPKIQYCYYVYSVQLFVFSASYSHRPNRLIFKK